MKKGKRDGTCDFSSDYLVHGTNALYVHLSLLLNAVFIHGCAPHDFFLSTVIPLVKSRKKPLNNSSNYRSIALSSVISKLLDIVLLNNNRTPLKCSEMQYGFRQKHSTVQCTFVLNETVEYYVSNRGSVHVMLLDASKAFDRAEYCKLFNVLRAKGLCPLVIRLLINMYVNQRIRVKWNNDTSDWIHVLNGVKQGGIASPILFTNYVDGLLNRLSESNFGCYVGHQYCGCLGYADDITLLAPTKFSSYRMLEICDDYAKDYDIMFNADKSHYIHFTKGRNASSSSIAWNGKNIVSSSREQHLGNLIGVSPDSARVKQSVNDFNRRVNQLNVNFSNVCLNVKYVLFKTFCMPLYGCQLWDFSSHHCNSFFTAWRKAIRRLLMISPRSHSNLLHLIVNDLPIEIQLHKRFIKFFYSILHSENPCTRICAHLELNNSNSLTGKSLNFICNLQLYIDLIRSFLQLEQFQNYLSTLYPMMLNPK